WRASSGSAVKGDPAPRARQTVGRRLRSREPNRQRREQRARGSWADATWIVPNAANVSDTCVVRVGTRTTSPTPAGSTGSDRHRGYALGRMEIGFDRFQGTAGYITSEPLRHAVNVALALERPLLLRGEPGTGKTLLAHHVAQALGMDLVRWHIKSTTK